MLVKYYILLIDAHNKINKGHDVDIDEEENAMSLSEENEGSFPPPFKDFV